MDLRAGDFEFTLTLRGGRPACAAREPRHAALADILDAIGVERLAGVVEQRSGFTIESVIGLSYAEDNPGEVTPGKVRLFRPGDEFELDRAFFEAAVAAYGLGAVALLREAALPVPDGLEERLKAIRARI